MHAQESVSLHTVFTLKDIKVVSHENDIELFQENLLLYCILKPFKKKQGWSKGTLEQGWSKGTLEQCSHAMDSGTRLSKKILNQGCQKRP